jgi:hypothetical protein
MERWRAFLPKSGGQKTSPDDHIFDLNDDIERCEGEEGDAMIYRK